MVLDIVTGSHFSQRKLFVVTNRFFSSPKFSRLISGRDSNYVIEIRKRAVKVIMSDYYEESDINKIKAYIQTLFHGSSILIASSGDLSWIHDIKNVKINTLEKFTDKAV